jgi:3-phosphoshikimate 1-carboxyvinyltransferase
MRLLSGLAAGQDFEVVLVGDESLTARPMRRVADPLGYMGATVKGTDRDGNIYPPLTIRGGNLRGIDYQSPVASAQVKSAILLAGLYAEGVTSVREPGSSRDHSERLLRYLGAPLTVPEPNCTVLDPSGWGRELEARPIVVPADPSSAAFVLAAALIAGVERVSVPSTCVNSTRTGFLDALMAMNALVEREAMNEDGSEPVANLVVSRGAGDAMKAAQVDGNLTVRSIDELPILAVVAAFADGETVFADAAELRVKESDRIATTCAMLRAFGVEVEERDDGMIVAGQRGRTLEPARVDAAGDHRIAMAGAVAALRAKGPCRIDDVDNVETSFPGFAELMNGLGADVRVTR